MDERWRILTRVRDVRARVALHEAMRERQLQAQAQEKLAEARGHRAKYAAMAMRAGHLLVAGGSPQVGADVVFSAARAQALVNFASGARLRVKEANVTIRRALLQCEHAREAVDEADAKYRLEAQRKENVDTHWQERLRRARNLRAEREDEEVLDQRCGASVVQAERGETE